MAAYGLYGHIESNKHRSVLLLVGLFLLVYLLVYAGALVAEAMSYQASLQYLIRKAWFDLLAAAPYATVGAAVWIVIAYYFHQWLMYAVTRAREETRHDVPRVYHVLGNRFIARAVTFQEVNVEE